MKKTKDVNVINQMVLALEVDVKRTPAKERARCRKNGALHYVCAYLRPEVKNLLLEQARKEGFNTSALLNKIVTDYLFEQETTIQLGQ